MINQSRLCHRFAISAIMLGAALGASALDLPVRTVNGRACYYYEVQPKETVYNLGRRFGLTKAQIIQYNPSVADGLRAGQVLYFPKSEIDASDLASPQSDNTPKESKKAVSTVTPNTSKPTVHVIKKGETIYGIARQYGITEAQLMAANPRLEERNLRLGSLLNIPIEEKSKVVETPTAKEEAVTTVATPPNRPAEKPVEMTPVTEPVAPTPVLPAEVPTVAEAETTTVTPEVKKLAPARISVMLPFMLSASQPDKQAQLYTEFYRGLLMAADSCRAAGRPIAISAYDTANSLDSVAAILALPELAQSTVIIAPDDEVQLGRITTFAGQHGAKVFNTFAVKSTLHRTDSAMMQANIPHSAMYDTAVDGMLDRFEGYTPVLLVPNDGKNDKIEFQARVKRKYSQRSLPVIEIPYHNTLKDSDLDGLDRTQRYLFIPASGTQTEFARVIPALKAYKEGLDDLNGAMLFGYPEWITFRNDALESMRFMNTTIYSRFFNDETSLRSKDFTANYSAWYGMPMLNAIPMQGILGFDTGMYIIQALNDGDKFPGKGVYRGIQTDFHFAPDADSKGTVNYGMYLINFRPSGINEKISL